MSSEKPAFSRFSAVYIAEFLIICASTFPQPFLYHYYGGARVIPVMYVLLYLGFAIEIAFGDRFKKNYEILKLNGFSNLDMFFSSLFSITFANFGVYGGTMLLYYLYGEAQPYFDLSLVAKVLVMLASSETVFTWVHSLLHNQLGHLHVMHHCCIHNSIATNFMFHPVDLLLELGSPAAIVLLTNELLFKDQWACICAISTMFGWYGLDHDALAELPHANHHKFINTVYTVYLNLKTHNKNDSVVKVVKRVKSEEEPTLNFNEKDALRTREESKRSKPN
jgi:sterol desaturase/sphingolipid hydroxylase (fatty acid hydroxylase superfamily)